VEVTRDIKKTYFVYIPLIQITRLELWNII